MINYIEIIGLIAGLCTTLSALPQIIKIYKTNSTKDLSIITYLLAFSGVVLWLIYGILLFSISLIISNLVAILLQFTIITMILKKKHNPDN
jgi:MtN3 and saliva related transmembrane protein